MAIHYLPSRPPTFQVKLGDVWVNRNNGDQELFVGPPTNWEVITSRGDVLPLAGASEQHLARANASNPFNTKWVVPSDGMVYQYDRLEADSSDQWEITHELRSRWVDVTVITPGNANPTAEQTTLIPRIEYPNAQRCVLHFARAVWGTALVRR